MLGHIREVAWAGLVVSKQHPLLWNLVPAEVTAVFVPLFLADVGATSMALVLRTQPIHEVSCRGPKLVVAAVIVAGPLLDLLSLVVDTLASLATILVVAPLCIQVDMTNLTARLAAKTLILIQTKGMSFDDVSADALLGLRLAEHMVALRAHEASSLDILWRELLLFSSLGCRVPLCDGGPRVVRHTGVHRGRDT